MSLTVSCLEKNDQNSSAGNEPGTSQLSFECSTNWATGESMSFLSKLSHYPVTLCDVFVHLTIRRWLTTFSTRVHLEHMYKCSSRLLACDLVKVVTIDVSDSLMPWEKNQNSSAGKWTQDFECSTNWATGESMSFLWKLSHYPVTLCVWCVCAPNHQVVTNYL